MMDHVLNSMWWWLGLAVLLGIGEMLTPGVFLIWVAAAAAVTGLFALLVPGLPITLQFLIFAGLCLLATWAGRRWYQKNPVVSQDPMLNDRASRLIGKPVTVVDAIRDGEGRVRIDDSTWSATGPDADVGARLVVISASGATVAVDWPSSD